MKYYTNEKKKKSVSLYDGAGTRDSEIIAKYMYEHRNL